MMIATEFLNILCEILYKIWLYGVLFYNTEADLGCLHQLYICLLTGNPHECKAECHEGLCPLCELTTLVRCRCGHMDQELPCVQVTTRADDARCQKKCTKVSNMNSKVSMINKRQSLILVYQ